MPTGTATLNVTELPDAEEWFVNAAAWSNYWANQSVDITLTPAATTLYVPAAAVDGDYYNINIDGMDRIIPSQAIFIALLTAFNSLDTSYRNLRSQLKDAGFIDNAQ